MKIPKKLGACLDLAYELRAGRIELQRDLEKKIDKLKEQEKKIKDHIINSFKKSDIEGAKGDVASASLIHSDHPSVKDWSRVYDWVKKTGSFEIFERRISKTAFKERLEAGEAIPGIEVFHVTELSLTKTKGK